jgi:inner membrane protein
LAARRAQPPRARKWSAARLPGTATRCRAHARAAHRFRAPDPVGIVDVDARAVAAGDVGAHLGGKHIAGLPQRRRAARRPDVERPLRALDRRRILVSEELYEEWHHRLAHGAVAAVVVTVLAFVLLRNAKAALLGCAAFHSHIAMDLAGSGPGWPILYFWPFADVEWLPSWQWNLASWQNSVFGLAVTLLCLSCALPYGRTPVELFSPRADGKVVAALRARFGRGPAR